MTLQNLILILLLAAAVFWDLKLRKIPNKITVPAALLGFLLFLFAEGGKGASQSALGFLLGLVIFLILYGFGGMGAGDVKLMAAVGALKGPEFVLRAALATALAGGLMALVVQIWKGRFRQTMINLLGILLLPLLKGIYRLTAWPKALEAQKWFVTKKLEAGNEYLPYAVAIALGTVAVLLGVFSGLFPQ
ncbi:prepilin peptidase [Proteiniclasticum sp. BAD-10]|uniref:Prepilin peptidase n=1 Tax=Proteiniclasticum sediminis TaxID=2804028 RepID=A0A941CPG9_9CLOT|nr:A24 family peptidase [Proteiniclasticum sediminis]MBR0575254.1 prepilin peptidase [Proteiniclasticum sediminis]